jgi:hypothetical protein
MEFLFGSPKQQLNYVSLLLMLFPDITGFLGPTAINMRTPVTFALEDAWPKFGNHVDVPEIICGSLVTCYPLAKVVTTFAAIKTVRCHGRNLLNEL